MATIAKARSLLKVRATSGALYSPGLDRTGSVSHLAPRALSTRMHWMEVARSRVRKHSPEICLRRLFEALQDVSYATGGRHDTLREIKISDALSAEASHSRMRGLRVRQAMRREIFAATHLSLKA
jgi:hypothetical protein